MPRKSSADLGFPTRSAARVTPPPDLTGAARSVFVDLVLGCRADHFLTSDIPLLVVYSKALALEKLASEGLAADGYVTAEARPSGWINVLALATRVISTYSRMLRLNPAARSMSAAPSSEPEQPVDYYERQRLEGRHDDGPEPN